MSGRNKLNNNKCRTCWSGAKGLQSLTKVAADESEEETKCYGELLKELLRIDIMDETFKEMPQTICSCCARKLRAAHAFVQQAQEVNGKLWSILQEDEAEKPIDCLQEAQIDIQNCLEIKMEDEETENNKTELSKFEVELKTEDPEEHINTKNSNKALSGVIDQINVMSPAKDALEATSPSSSPTKLNDCISECDDDYDAEDLFDSDFAKPINKATDSEEESICSNDSDWRDDTILESDLKDNEVDRKKSSNHSKKKTKPKNLDDNIPTPCDQCDRVFPNSRLLSRHKRHTHVPEELKVQCPYCVAKFGRRHNMYAHMRTHHKDKPIEEHITQQRKFPRQYACDQCDGTYTSKYYLLAHMKIKHNPDSAPKKPERIILPKKRFLCTLCGSKFDTQSNLDVHIRRHTGEKPYKCDLCERAFYRPCDVQAHRRSHTGEKPFKCSICEKAFARSNKLKIHMRTHSNERPYKCEQCEKAFKHSKDLNIHKRIHTGERPYTCGVCQSTFTQSNSLKLHQTKQQHFEIIDQVVSC